MSALAGLWNFSGKPGAGASCARMLATQAIYGPHDNAQWDADWIALGRDLFRTLPEDMYDTQPVLGANGRFVLAADLRLDNRDDLVRELQIPAERARVMADSAILLAAWERWQENCFDHLVGDYAFALWDGAQQRLVLARDPLGQRPLHFHRGKDFFAFASMPKGLHALAEIPRVPDEERVAELIALMPEYGSRSFYKGIERVESGQVLVVSREGITQRIHWNPPPRRLELGSTGEYVEAMRHLLDQAVESRLRGANKVGAHLSAGLDSSGVAATAARLLAPRGGKVIAFTSVPREGYAGPSPRGTIGDEGPLAANTAALYANMEHVLIRDGGAPLDGLERSFFFFDRPILNLCNQRWIDEINNSARDRKLGVMLCGQMGNMSLTYDGLTLLPKLISEGRWLHWLREAHALSRRGNKSWAATGAVSIGPWLPRPVWKWLKRVARGSAPDISEYTAINMDRYRELEIDKRASENGLDVSYRPRINDHASRLWVMRRVDLGNYNKGILGGWGIDMRDPTADRRLMEFCLSVPEEQFLSDGVPRALGRRALADRLPQAVVSERRKGRQAVDWHEHVTAARDSLRDEVERLGENEMASRALDVARMRRLIEDWPEDGWEREDVQAAYRLALMRGISAGHFLRKASGGNR